MASLENLEVIVEAREDASNRTSIVSNAGTSHRASIASYPQTSNRNSTISNAVQHSNRNSTDANSAAAPHMNNATAPDTLQTNAENLQETNTIPVSTLSIDSEAPSEVHHNSGYIEPELPNDLQVKGQDSTDMADKENVPSQSNPHSLPGFATSIQLPGHYTKNRSYGKKGGLSGKNEEILMEKLAGLTDTVDRLNRKVDNFIESQSEILSMRSAVYSHAPSVYSMPRLGNTDIYSTLPGSGHNSRPSTIRSTRRLVDGRTPVSSVKDLRFEPEDYHDEEKDDSDENPVRGNWSGRVEFLLSCLGYAVGLGNVWRFPYKCYDNGGGAFLIPYFIMLLFIGMPIFFMEVVIGQFSSSGPITCWRLSPMFTGVGWAMVIMSSFVAIYYNMVVAWALYYLGASFSALPGLPWDNCDNYWNDQSCYHKLPDINCTGTDLMTYDNGTCYNVTGNATMVGLWNATLAEKAGITRTSASEQYFNNYVLGLSSGVEELGGVQWQLACSLIGVWILVFLCLIKSIKSSGKVVYFTALYPYAVLIILFGWSLSLPGYYDGIMYYITPDWQKLQDAKVWFDAANQILLSLSACMGGLMALSSYNQFHNNCFRDMFIVTIGNSLTSVFAGFVVFAFLGFMAHSMGTTVDKVAQGGTGLAFIVYPEAVTNMPVSPLWAILFFTMLLTLGLDSQFVLVETVTTALIDRWNKPLWKHQMLFTFLTCCLFCAIGLVLTTKGGIYVLNLMDSYVLGWAVLIIALCECLAVMGVYGWYRFSHDISIMLGSGPWLWWRLLWTILTPCCVGYVLLYSWVDYQVPLQNGVDPYPLSATVIGWLLTISIILPIFIAPFVVFCMAEGSFKERMRQIALPSRSWGPALLKHRRLVTYVKGAFWLDPGNARLIGKPLSSNPYTLNSVKAKGSPPASIINAGYSRD